jgi:hypothetical protein
VADVRDTELNALIRKGSQEVFFVNIAKKPIQNRKALSQRNHDHTPHDQIMQQPNMDVLKEESQETQDHQLRNLSQLCHLILVEADRSQHTPPRDTKRNYIPTPPSTERLKPTHQ